MNGILTRNATGSNKNTFTGRYLLKDTSICSFFFPHILTSFSNAMNEKDALKPVFLIHSTRALFPLSNYDCILPSSPPFLLKSMLSYTTKTCISSSEKEFSLNKTPSLSSAKRMICIMRIFQNHYRDCFRSNFLPVCLFNNCC